MSLRCFPNGTVFSLYLGSTNAVQKCLLFREPPHEIKRRASDVYAEYHTVLYDCLSAFKLWLARPQFVKKNLYCVRCFFCLFVFYSKYFIRHI